MTNDEACLTKPFPNLSMAVLCAAGFLACAPGFTAIASAMRQTAARTSQEALEAMTVRQRAEALLPAKADRIVDSDESCGLMVGCSFGLYEQPAATKWRKMCQVRDHWFLMMKGSPQQSSSDDGDIAYFILSPRLLRTGGLRLLSPKQGSAANQRCGEAKPSGEKLFRIGGDVAQAVSFVNRLRTVAAKARTGKPLANELLCHGCKDARVILAHMPLDELSSVEADHCEYAVYPCVRVTVGSDPFNNWAVEFETRADGRLHVFENHTVE